MRILMLSLDKTILDPLSSAHRRMKEYSPYVSELVIVIPDSTPKEVTIAPHITARATGGGNKAAQFFRLFRIATKIVQERPIECITTQDPFFLGLIGWSVAQHLKNLAFNVQLHGIFFNNPYWIQETWFNRVRAVLARFVVRRADSIRVVSARLKEEVHTLGVPLERIVVVPPFVDIPAIEKRSVNPALAERFKNYPFIFLTVGRLVPGKNIEMVIDAFAGVVKSQPESALLVVGEGSEKQNLLARARALHLENKIIFEPWSNDVISYYKMANVLLFPSLHESFGMVPLEALASGTPVITGQVGWIDKRACVLKGIYCVSSHETNAWVEEMRKARIAFQRRAPLPLPDAPREERASYLPTARIVYPFSKEANLKEQARAWRLAIDTKRRYRLLFITQRINEKDDDLAFVIGWIDEFRRRGAEVQVICLLKQTFDNHFSVYSLGKENGVGLVGRVLRFYWYIVMLRYDRVYVHMNPEYMTLGGFWWWLSGIPSYLWYTHYTMHLHLWFSHLFCKRLFAATAQSMPMYADDPKRIITGHGVPTAYWLEHADVGVGSGDAGVQSTHVYTPDIIATPMLHPVGQSQKFPPTNLLVVHRLCRSKRLDMVIRALKLLPEEYTLTVYGRDVEKDYVAELHELIKKEQLEHRVTFKGPLPMPELRFVYPRYHTLVNMAWETIDKTMLEAMLNGLQVVTTKRNAEAIGLPYAPEEETAEAVARFILELPRYRVPAAELRDIVMKNHSVEGLIEQMNAYVKRGI